MGRTARTPPPHAWLIAALITLLGTTCATAASRTTFTRWYAVLMDGQQVGWSRTKVAQSDQPASITTSTRMKIAIRRGPVTMQMAIENTFVETPDGKPIKARSIQRFGQTSVSQIMHFNDDSIEWVTRQGTLKQRREIPLPKVPPGQDASNTPWGWLPPAAAQRLIAQRLAEGAPLFHYWSLDPGLGIEPVRVETRVIGPQDVEVFGKVVPAIAADSSVSKLPDMVTREHLDAQGWAVKSHLSMGPGMTLTIIQADKELATAKVQPPELLASTLIKPDKPLHNPRGLRSAVYELSLPETDGEPATAPPSWPSSGYQRVERPLGSAARIVVDLDQPTPPADDTPTDANLAVTAMLNGTDPVIKRLVKQATRGAATDASTARRAELIRAFVRDFISAKDLSVGLATASEVARTAQGDCTEHAVLLAAMLRAAGIPSRTVSGLIYIDEFVGQADVFAYHMWAQAWLDDAGNAPGRWVDLDATLDRQPFDAAHIALSTSDMADDAMMNDLIVMVPLIGRLKIKVVDTAVSTVPTTDQR